MDALFKETTEVGCFNDLIGVYAALACAVAAVVAGAFLELDY